jgi:DegV family protein with EDD domain
LAIRGGAARQRTKRSPIVSIRVVTDSTCDLPEHLIAEHAITVVPLYINMDGESLLDGEELSRDEFYRRLPTMDPAPTTAVPSPSMFAHAYERLAEAGASAIVSIHISEKLSGTVNVARLAADALSSIPVSVLDSRTLSLGTGFLALAAARAAEAGESMKAILDLVRRQASRTHVFAALDTLEFLRRSGRMNRFMSALGGWLKLKPLLTMTDGEPAAERVRTTRRATDRLLELLAERMPLAEAAIVHTRSPERASELHQRALGMLPPGEILSVDITPVFGVHLGPGAAGFACVTEG